MKARNNRAKQHTNKMLTRPPPTGGSKGLCKQANAGDSGSARYTYVLRPRDPSSRFLLVKGAVLGLVVEGLGMVGCRKNGLVHVVAHEFRTLTQTRHLKFHNPAVRCRVDNDNDHD